jgi:hypothetical protein
MRDNNLTTKSHRRAMQQREVPLYSIHPRAKLYKQYTALIDTTIDATDTLEIEYNNYVCHFTFAWQFTDDISISKSQPLQGLIQTSESTVIRTNCTKDIAVGDIVALQWAKGEQAGNYQIIDVRQQYYYTPKMIKTYCYLSIERLP